MAGYKEPPKHTQFKKGKSGNLKGRPKGAKNKNTIQELLEKELNSELKLADGSVITKKDAAVKNFTNTIVKTDKPHEAARGLEIIQKMELEGEESVKARQFVAKILKNEFLDEDDIDDFIKGRKDPKFNYPKSVNKLYNKERIKDIAAWESVKKVITISEFFRMIELVDSIEILIKNLKNEIYSADKIRYNVLPILEDGSEAKNKVIALLDDSNNSENEHILSILYRMLVSEKNNLRFYMFYQRDYLKNRSYYKENEKDFFEKDIIDDTLNKTSEFTREELERANVSMKNSYDYFMDQDEIPEYMYRKDLISDEEHNDLAIWLKVSS